MGLAASQTRFLCLTARKSNIEFQGQQINQQRTVLANQSADLYNRMLALNVPTPPSMTNEEYYKVTQEFFNPDTGLNTQLLGSPSLIWDNNGTDNIGFNFTTLYTENGIDKEGTINTIFTSITDINTELGNLGLATIPPAAVTSQNDLEALTDQQKTDIQQALISIGIMQVDNATGSLIQKLQLDLDNDKATTFDNGDADGVYDAGEDLELSGTDFAFGTHFNDALFDEASATYEHDKFVYEKAMADINAETESIYQKDKTLELKLKQLDSEHSAVQTEIDAVKSVIKKNVETTFKTFGS